MVSLGAARKDSSDRRDENASERRAKPFLVECGMVIRGKREIWVGTCQLYNEMNSLDFLFIIIIFFGEKDGLMM